MEWRLETKENFYDNLVELWKQHNFPIMPYRRVANRIFVAYDQLDADSEPVILYAIQVYVTDSSMCQIAFPTSNKKAPWELKKGVLEKMIYIIEIAMKTQGYDFIYTTSDTPKLMNIFTKADYLASDEGVTYYSKSL